MANTLWYVATDGDDNNDCLSPVSACFTMQAAVDKASPDNTIIIATGVYTQNTTFDKSLAVQGAGRESTIVDGNAVSTVFTVTQYSTVTISALTIRNGRAASGGGVYNGGVLTLADCQVAENTAVGAVGTSGGDGGNAYGGGIFNSATLTVSQCLLTDNVAVGGDADGMGRGGNSEGGGIYSVGALILENSIISHSIAAGGKELEKDNFTVTIGHMNLAEIRRYLTAQLPLLAGVHTADLSYWSQAVDHVVVVIGVDDIFVYVNDPSLVMV